MSEPGIDHPEVDGEAHVSLPGRGITVLSCSSCGPIGPRPSLDAAATVTAGTRSVHSSADDAPVGRTRRCRSGTEAV